MRQQHDLIQGSPEWHQFRLEHFGASEAAAMLGLSPHVKRSELLRMKHTGIAKEFSEWFQENILDNGHAVEAAALPMAEAIIGDELYPATYSEGKLSASCDGLTMDGTTAFEHKQWNITLADSVRENFLPDEYQPQVQQVMMVTGAERLLFMVSDGTADRMIFMWVTPDAEWRKKLLQGWAQFSEDLANYQHVEAAPEPVPAAIEQLPALLVQVEGRVLTTNLSKFKQKARSFIDNIKTELTTDQDFADAEKMTKFLKDGESRLEAVKEHALSQTASIDELFRDIDAIRDEMRAKRLTLEKSVDAQKKTIRATIQATAEATMRMHIDTLNKRIGKPYMPDRKWADFVSVMKGKKTITSLRDACDTELARGKIAANEVADRIQTNLNDLYKLATDHLFLFHDTAQIVLKENDDLTALIKARIADHKEAEKKKAEQERAKAAAALTAQAGVDEPAAAAAIAQAGAFDGFEPGTGATPPDSHIGVGEPPSLSVPPGSTVRFATRSDRPTDDEIIVALALHYHVHESKVIEWLLDLDLRAANERMSKEFAA